MTRGPQDPNIVSLYVVAGMAPEGDRGLLADSPRDLQRVVDVWSQGGATVTVRRGGKRRAALRALLGVDMPGSG